VVRWGLLERYNEHIKFLQIKVQTLKCEDSQHDDVICLLLLLLRKSWIKNGDLGRLIRFYYLHSGHKQLPPTHGHAILTCQMLTNILNGKNDPEIKSLRKQGLLARLRPFLGLNLEIWKPVTGEKLS
jgi:hypothetical protein